MTEKRYLEQLDHRLQAYPPAFRKKMTAYIGTYFKEGALQGRTAEEIIERLGTVDDVMDNISMLYHEPAQEQREKHSFFSFTILQCILVCDTIMLQEVRYGCSV